MVLKKPLEEIVDLATGNWKCGFCEGKKKYFEKEKILEALKEKNGKMGENNGNSENQR